MTTASSLQERVLTGNVRTDPLVNLFVLPAGRGTAWSGPRLRRGWVASQRRGTAGEWLQLDSALPRFLPSVLRPRRNLSQSAKKKKKKMNKGAACAETKKHLWGIWITSADLWGLTWNDMCTVFTNIVKFTAAVHSHNNPTITLYVPFLHFSRQKPQKQKVYSYPWYRCITVMISSKKHEVVALSQRTKSVPACPSLSPP